MMVLLLYQTENIMAHISEIKFFIYESWYFPIRSYHFL